MTPRRILVTGFAAAAAAASLLAIAFPASAQELELRLGTGTPPSHVWTRAAERLADQVDEASDGAIEITVFPAAQLGPESDLIQQVSVGVLDMAIVSAAATSARAPAMLAWFTPFALDDVADTVEASKTPVAQDILGTLEQQNIRGLGYVFAGMRHILMADTEVRSLDDLARKKIRITPFPGMQVWWQAAGAVPTPVQLADVYQSLDSGLLDGVDIDLDALVGLSLQQVADYLILTNHMAFPGIAMITEDTWSQMTGEQQELLTGEMDDVLTWAADQQIQAEKDNLAQMEDDLTVIRLDDAKSIFADANAAFDESFGDIPEVAAFKEQVAE